MSVTGLSCMLLQKPSKGQCRDRRCHVLTSLSVSATSWTLLLSPFLSHFIFLPSSSALCFSALWMRLASTIAWFSLQISFWSPIKKTSGLFRLGCVEKSK